MKIILDASVRKTLKRLPKDQALRLLTAIEKLPAGDVKRLQGRDDYRLRVGDWGVIFEMEAETIMVTVVASRGDVYKR